MIKNMVKKKQYIINKIFGLGLKTLTDQNKRDFFKMSQV